MAIASVGQPVSRRRVGQPSRRRVDRDKVRSLCEAMLAYPGATIQEYADQLGVTRRTIERWRRYEAFQIELHALSQERFNNVLLPRALRAAEKMLDGDGGQPAVNLVIEILRAQGMLGIRRVDVHHSGRVDVDLRAVRQRVIDRIEELGAGPPSVAPDEVGMREPLRLPVIEAEVIDAKPIANNGDGAT